MCQDQGLAIVPWQSLGGGSLLSEEQRKQLANDPKARKVPINEQSIRISKVLEDIARKYETTLQAVVSCHSTALGHHTTSVLMISGFGISIRSNSVCRTHRRRSNSRPR